MRIAGWQIGIGMAGALVWAIVAGMREALAALVGGGIGAGLTLIFALYAFRRRGEDPRSAVFALFQGAAVKLASAAIVFGLSAKYFPEYYIALLSTFVPGLTGYWMALLWFRPDGK
ncbi:F0F1-type ATP synthase assembly protein I [Methylohalomonas lacus]|uniref:F0F1-type ATP synthase assembly protein I n=1 Tax=Methylohalomonas lacus TaxID=398773 RepID=A0AAE3HJC7_9GAMM|nr:F0F1-type ATP synthase assembly protein I [Methylohalomonas lacus]